MPSSAKTRFFNRPQWQLTLGIMFISQILTAVGFSIIFPFLPLYVQDLGSSTGVSIEFLAGMVFSAQGFTMMIAAPFWGALADRYGRKLMVLRALFGGAVILLLMAFVQSAEQLVLLRAVQGMVTGTVAAANALVASVAPRERMGFAMGSLQVGLWAGLALGPLIGGFLADTYGYAAPFIATSALIATSGFLVLFGIQEKFTPSANLKKGTGSFINEWRHVISMPGVPLLYLIRFLNGLGRTMIVPFAPLFLATLLADNAAHESTYAGIMVAIGSAASTFTAIYLGRLGDKIGHRKILIGSAVMAAVCYMPQAFVTEVWQLLFLQGLTGAAAGGIIAAPSAMLAQYTTPGEEGAVYGLDNSIVSGSRAAAPLVGSAIAVMIGLRGTFIATGLLFMILVFVGVRWLPKSNFATSDDQFRISDKAVPAGTD